MGWFVNQETRRMKLIYWARTGRAGSGERERERDKGRERQRKIHALSSVSQTRRGQGRRKVLFVSLGHHPLPNSLPWFLSCPVPSPSYLLSYKKPVKTQRISLYKKIYKSSFWGRLGGSVGWASDFGSGHDLPVCEFKPRMGLSAVSSDKQQQQQQQQQHKKVKKVLRTEDYKGLGLIKATSTKTSIVFGLIYKALSY